MSQKKPTFGGEVQFAGYSDSSRSGPRITFRMADRDELEAFIGKEGKRYMLAVVEIADDETAAAPTPPAAPKAPAPRRERLAPLCEWAVMRCAEPEFQRWAAARWDSGDMALTVHPEDVVPKTREEWAKYIVCLLCEVSSRKELDTNPDAAKRLHDLVRKPYAAWLERQQVPA